jgi:histone H3/H4
MEVFEWMEIRRTNFERIVRQMSNEKISVVAIVMAGDSATLQLQATSHYGNG